MTVALGGTYIPGYAGDNPTLYKQKFSRNVHIKSQQMAPRLWNLIPNADESLAGADSIFIPVIDTLEGHTASGVITGSPPWTESDGSNAEYNPGARIERTRWRYGVSKERQLNGTEWRWALITPRKDAQRMGIDIDSKMVQQAAFSLNRRRDKTIITAFGADVLEWQKASGAASSSTNMTGKTATTVSFPTANIITDDGKGMTLEKVREARRLMNAAEVPEYGRYIAYTSQQDDDFLSDDRVISNDFAHKQLIMNGQQPLLGFTFIRTELLDISSNIRQCWAFQVEALEKASEEELFSSKDTLPTWNHADQNYLEITNGAVRMFEEKIYRIDCLEPAA